MPLLHPAHVTHKWLDEQEAVLLRRLETINRAIYPVARQEARNKWVELDKYRVALLMKQKGTLND